MSEPREHTKEEMARFVLDHLNSIAKHWGTTDVARHYRQMIDHYESEAHYRAEGAMFSFLVMLDGGSGFMPSFLLTPDPHPDDKEYDRERGNNWWPQANEEQIAGSINWEYQLHEMLKYSTHMDDVLSMTQIRLANERLRRLPTVQRNDQLRAKLAVTLQMLDLVQLDDPEEHRIWKEALVLCKEDDRFKDLHGIFEKMEEEHGPFDRADYSGSGVADKGDPA